ncbi:glycosyltransferase [Candidatus Omnitrophota bacterium]
MNIGYLYPAVDYPPTTSTSVVAFHFSKQFSERGHRLYSFYGYTNPMINRCKFINFIRKVDAVFFRPSGPLFWDVLTLIKLIRPSLPIVWQLEFFANEGIRSPWYLPDIEKRWMFYTKFVDGIICISKEVHDYASRFRNVRENCLVPNGSDPIMFSPERASKGIFHDLDGCTKILWLGSGRYAWHDLDVISRLAKKFLQIDKNVKFILITKLSALTKRSDFRGENIVILDQISHLSAPKYIAAADICLCLYNKAYYKKAFPRIGFFQSPLKLFDYMASARPVIASSLGQIARVIRDGENGLLTDNSIDDIVQKILYLTKNKKRSEEMGSAARRDVIEFYNWGRAAEQAIDVFKKVVYK